MVTACAPKEEVKEEIKTEEVVGEATKKDQSTGVLVIERDLEEDEFFEYYMGALLGSVGLLA